MLEPEILAKFVKEHRKIAGLSQIRLAELAQVGKTLVFDIENGKATVRIDSIRKILKVLNIKVKLISPLIDNKQLNEKS